MYALFGSQLVAIWVGEAHAPNSPLGYALAGGAILAWDIQIADSVCKLGLALRQLNWAAGIELLGETGYHLNSICTL